MYAIILITVTTSGCHLQVLYKVQVVGAEHVLPVFDGFLLPLPASVAVFTASQALVLASGSVLYLYGYVKFNAFLNAEKEKYHILSKHGHQVRIDNFNLSHFKCTSSCDLCIILG